MSSIPTTQTTDMVRRNIVTPETVWEGRSTREDSWLHSAGWLICVIKRTRRRSDTLNIPHTKGTFPHMFNVSVNYDYVGPLPAMWYYDSNGMNEPLRTQLIKWHKAH